MGGLVSHLMWVEKGWFERAMAGRDYPVPWSDADPDADFRQVGDETLADVLDYWRTQAG